MALVWMGARLDGRPLTQTGGRLGILLCRRGAVTPQGHQHITYLSPLPDPLCDPLCSDALTDTAFSENVWVGAGLTQLHKKLGVGVRLRAMLFCIVVRLFCLYCFIHMFINTHRGHSKTGTYSNLNAYTLHYIEAKIDIMDFLDPTVFSICDGFGTVQSDTAQTAPKLHTLCTHISGIYMTSRAHFCPPILLMVMSDAPESSWQTFIICGSGRCQDDTTTNLCCSVLSAV